VTESGLSGVSEGVAQAEGDGMQRNFSVFISNDLGSEFTLTLYHERFWTFLSNCIEKRVQGPDRIQASCQSEFVGR
jgi:hypothetical protein